MKKISWFEAYIKSSNEEAYKYEINELTDKNGHLNFKYGKWKTHYRYDILIKKLKEIIENYNKDGKDIYEIFVSEIQSSNYPTEIKEKLLKEIKNDLFSKKEKANKQKASNKKNKKDHQILEGYLKTLKISDSLLYYSLYDYYGNIEKDKVKEKLLTLPLNIQKKLISYNNDIFRLFKDSRELSLYAIQNHIEQIHHIKEEFQNDIKFQLAAIKNHNYSYIKKLNLLPQAKIEYIKTYPEKIITEITKFNYNQEEELTIYDLNKEELEIYKQSIEKYFINKVKNDPTSIKEIKNPSKLVSETALAVFKEQYVR